MWVASLRIISVWVWQKDKVLSRRVSQRWAAPLPNFIRQSSCARPKSQSDFRGAAASLLIPLTESVSLPPSLREVADRRSDEGSNRQQRRFHLTHSAGKNIGTRRAVSADSNCPATTILHSTFLFCILHFAFASQSEAFGGDFYIQYT